MGLWGALTGEVKRIFVARPDFAKTALVYKHPDSNIRKGTELTVDADEIALFFRDGTIRGTLGPGRHTLTTDEVPFLGLLIDAATGGNLYISEIYFVTTREVPDVKFGGPIGDLQDPQTEQIVSLAIYGEFSVKITDPEKFVVGFVGMRKTGNDEILAWFKQIFLRTIKDAIAELIVKQKWPLLSVTSGAYTEEICEESIKRAEPSIGKYGISVVTLANFHASMSEEDQTRLKQFANTAAMSKMAGGYQNYAMGEGMMHGGGGGGGSGVDMMGMMMAQQMMQNQQRGIQSPWGNNAPPAAAPPAAPAAATPEVADAKSAAKAKLAELKDLLKDELITQEEFDAKKKEILSRL